MPKRKSDSEFLKMLRNSEGTIVKICLMYAGRNAEEVRDLYQEIVANLYEGWPQFRHQCSPNTWVYRIALNTAISQLRSKAAKARLVPLDMAELDGLLRNTEDEMLERLYDLINQLDDNEKALLRMYMDRMDSKEMSAILGLSESAVNHRIHNLKIKLIKLNAQQL